MSKTAKKVNVAGMNIYMDSDNSSETKSYDYNSEDDTYDNLNEDEYFKSEPNEDELESIEKEKVKNKKSSSKTRNSLLGTKRKKDMLAGYFRYTIYKITGGKKPFIFKRDQNNIINCNHCNSSLTDASNISNIYYRDKDESNENLPIEIVSLLQIYDYVIVCNCGAINYGLLEENVENIAVDNTTLDNSTITENNSLEVTEVTINSSTEDTNVLKDATVSESTNILENAAVLGDTNVLENVTVSEDTNVLENATVDNMNMNFIPLRDKIAQLSQRANSGSVFTVNSSNNNFVSAVFKKPSIRKSKSKNNQEDCNYVQINLFDFAESLQ